MKSIVKHLREIGREKILERLKAIQNNEYVPDDILSNIMKNYSNSFLNDVHHINSNFSVPLYRR